MEGKRSASTKHTWSSPTAFPPGAGKRLRSRPFRKLLIPPWPACSAESVAPNRCLKQALPIKHLKTLKKRLRNSYKRLSKNLSKQLSKHLSKNHSRAFKTMKATTHVLIAFLMLFDGSISLLWLVVRSCPGINAGRPRLRDPALEALRAPSNTSTSYLNTSESYLKVHYNLFKNHQRAV